MGLGIENHLMKRVVLVKRLSKELLGTGLPSEAPATEVFRCAQRLTVNYDISEVSIAAMGFPFFQFVRACDLMVRLSLPHIAHALHWVDRWSLWGHRIRPFFVDFS
jgi:hypothetical protein